MRAPIVAAAAAAAVLATVAAVSAVSSPARKTAACPAAWRAGWQRLADRIQAPVYCPTWMPNPLDAKIGGPVGNGVFVKRDRSYLVSFLYDDGGDEVHVNFRGYPGRTRIPTCIAEQTLGTRTTRTKAPCFASPSGTFAAGSIRATLYTVNQDEDQWHLLYAWRHDGSLYAVSEHVISRYDSAAVLRNLRKLLRGLALVEPRKATR